MSDKEKDSTEKSIRILKILKRLSKGEIINIEKVSNEYNVHRKTVQRDIESLRAYFLEENSSEIKYSKTKKRYYLINNDQNNFTNEETLAISKIILESRAFNKTELEKLLKKLIKQATNEDRKIIEDIIKNEEFNYSPLQHGKNLLSVIWDLSQYIVNKELINIKYTTKDGVQKNYEAKSLSIMFSEYYFYLITYVNGKEEYPAILRIDRISEIKRKNQKFLLPYNERFEDGKFRKYVSFMHSGPLTKIKFRYKGYIDYVLDKFPTAVIESEENIGKQKIYTVIVEVYGSFGAEMWLKSQGDYVIDYKIIK